MSIGTNAWQVLPTWTTANRPSVLAKGYIGFNITDNIFEGWDGSSWVDLGASGGGGGGGAPTNASYLVLGTNGTLTDERVLTAPASGLTLVDAGPGSTLTIALANDLAALEALSGTGLGARTGTSAWALRTITGASGGGIDVTDGDGVSGNPTLALTTIGRRVPFLLASDVVSTATTPLYPTGMSFTPVAGALYHVELFLMTSTSVTSSAPRPGMDFPGGTAISVAFMTHASQGGTTTTAWRHWGDPTAGGFIATTGHTTATDRYPCDAYALVQAGASPSGDWKLTFQGENANTVTLHADSVMYVTRLR